MDFPFRKKNYLLLIISVILIALGLILMIGGGSEDPNQFSYDIFDFRRLTLAPILMAIGFVLGIIAIMYKYED